MIVEILERHRDELAFLWPQRAAATIAGRHDLRTLGDLDERVEAHLDGLRIGGEAGLAVVAEAGEPGVAFAAAALGVERGGAALSAALPLAADPALGRAVRSAFGWVEAPAAIAAAEPLLGAEPALHALAIAAHAAHRRDPGGALANALLDADAGVRARALRAAGELGRVDLLPQVAAAIADDDEACRFWAAWAAALLGAPASAALWGFVESRGPYAPRAVEMAARRTEPREAEARLAALSARPEHARVALIGAGALGDPGAAPWVFERMADPALARLAAEAAHRIAGVAVEGELAASPPAGSVAGPSDDPDDDAVAADPDADRPWPATAALATAFRARASELRRGARYLLGQPITDGLAARVLREGRQPERAAAALERSLLAPGRPLFEVRAPAFRQRRAP